MTRARLAALSVLMLLPVVAALPMLLHLLAYNPLEILSGLAPLQPGPIMKGQPGWVDPDIGLVIQALGKLAADQWLAGIVPWWNPYSGPGLPLAETMQPGALFLPFVLLLHFHDGVFYLRIVLEIIAGLSSFALLRHLGLGMLAATLGGVLFELNGTFAWLADAPSHVIAFLPLLLLGIEHGRAAAGASRPGGWAMTAIALAASLHAGFPEEAYIDGLLAACWCGFRFFTFADSGRWRYAAKTGAGLAVGLLLSMPSLLPFLGYLARGDLGAGHGANGYSSVVFPPMDWALTLMPTALGPFGAYYNGGADPIMKFGSFMGGYIGILTFLLALLSLLGGRREVGLRRLLAGFVLLACLKMIQFAPVKWLLAVVPFLDLTAFVRYDSAALEMACAILAAFTIDDWRLGRVVHPRLPAVIAGAAILGSVTALLPYVPPLWHQRNFQQFFLGTIGWSIGGSALLIALLARPARAVAIRWLAALLVVTSLGSYMATLVAGYRKWNIDLAAIGFLRDHIGLERFVTFGPFQPNYGAYFGIASLNSIYVPNPDIWTTYIHRALDPYGFANIFDGRWPHLPGQPGLVATFEQNLDGYRRLGLRYVLAYPEIPGFENPLPALAADPRLTRVYADPMLVILEVPDPTPYFRSTGGDCRLDIGSRTELVANCTAPATLHRNEMFFPGWRALVNGRPVAIAEDDAITQQIPIPAGRSVIGFRYAPPLAGPAWGLFWLGVIATLGSLLYRGSGRLIVNKE